MFQSIHDYVTEKNAAAEKQKEDQIAADARIAQELQDAQTEAANARATGPTQVPWRQQQQKITQHHC